MNPRALIALNIALGETPERARHIIRAVALNAALPQPPGDPTAAIVQRHRNALARAYRGAMQPLADAVANASSPEEALEKLRDTYRTWAPRRLEAELETALQLAAATA